MRLKAAACCDCRPHSCTRPGAPLGQLPASVHPSSPRGSRKPRPHALPGETRPLLPSPHPAGARGRAPPPGGALGPWPHLAGLGQPCGQRGVLWPSGPEAALWLRLGVPSAPPRRCCLEGAGGPPGHVGGRPLPRSEQHKAAGASARTPGTEPRAPGQPSVPGLQGSAGDWPLPLREALTSLSPCFLCGHSPS